MRSTLYTRKVFVLHNNLHSCPSFQTNGRQNSSYFLINSHVLIRQYLVSLFKVLIVIRNFIWSYCGLWLCVPVTGNILHH